MIIGPSSFKRAAFAAALLAGVTAGCGTTHHQSSNNQQLATQQVTQTVRSYLRAQVAGDGQSACSLLTASGQQELISLVMQAGKGLVITRPSCADAVMLVQAVAGQQILTALDHARVGAIQISATRATAQVVDGTAFPNEQVSLEKVGTAWKIASVPGLSGLGQ